MQLGLGRSASAGSYPTPLQAAQLRLLLGSLLHQRLGAATQGAFSRDSDVVAHVSAQIHGRQSLAFALPPQSGVGVAALPVNDDAGGLVRGERGGRGTAVCSEVMRTGTHCAELALLAGSAAAIRVGVAHCDHQPQRGHWATDARWDDVSRCTKDVGFHTKHNGQSVLSNRSFRVQEWPPYERSAYCEGWCFDPSGGERSRERNQPSQPPQPGRSGSR